MVRALMIIEAAGRPADYVDKAIKEYVGKINGYNDVVVHSMKFSEPKKIERDKEMSDFYSCFSEVDVECETFLRLSELVIDFLPSSVEVFEPSKVSLDCVEATSLLNNISGKLHRYDEIAKIAYAKINELRAQVEELSKSSNSKNAEPEKKTKKAVKRKKKT